MAFVVEHIRHRGPPTPKSVKPAPQPTGKSPLSVEMEALAERIGRIRPVGRNGDADPFYLDRSQVKDDARKLAEWERTGRQPANYVLAGERGMRDEHRTRYSRR